MPDPVNLRAARKARDRAEKRALADANAARFGRTKAQKALDQAQADKTRRDLDGHSLKPVPAGRDGGDADGPLPGTFDKQPPDP